MTINIFRYKIFFILLFFIFTCNALYSLDITIYLMTEKKGLLVSNNGGNSWYDFNKGLPENVLPLRVYYEANTTYLITRNCGVFKLNKNNLQWMNISSRDFKRRSQYKQNSQYRKISAFHVDKNNPESLLLATKHNVYTSKNAGKHWRKISLRGISKRNYITALSEYKNKIYAGTSFNGIFTKNGNRFSKRSKGLSKEPYSGTLSFYEEISKILTVNSNLVYVGSGFNGDLHVSRNRGFSWKKIETPGKRKLSNRIDDVQFNRGNLFISKANDAYKLEKNSKEWISLNYNKYLRKASARTNPLGIVVIDNKKNVPPIFLSIERKAKKSHVAKKALYSSIPSIRKRLNNLIKTIKQSGFNSIVIDMKDDFGNLYYPTGNKVAFEIRSARRPVKVKKIIKTLKDNGIYTIGRIVVFKDEKMYRAYGKKYAIKNRRTGGPWKGSKHEYWVDPHSDFVQNYNITIAKELEQLGFDEIQFDYIRFPSDGATSLCFFSFQKDKAMYKSEILMDFLRKAKDNLSIPISVDIYGFNSWYHFGNWIGQDMEEFSYIVDAISPMVYPSHFGGRFYMSGNRAERPFRIVHDGGLRANLLINYRVAIRPYLQAFKMMSPTWGPGYILNQIKGSVKSGCKGYIFWNARGDYKIIKRTLGKGKLDISNK